MPDGAKRKGKFAMQKKELSTAEALITLRTELVRGGFSEESAESIAHVAAVASIEENGLVVRA